MLQFLWGIVFGAVLVLAIIYVLLFDPFRDVTSRRSFVEHFQPLRLPRELRQFLSGNGENEITKWESCFNLSLILHFLFQEHKDTRRLRRWIYKKLQLELSDLTTRNAAGRLIQDIRISDLSIGSSPPVIKAVRVESFEMSEEEEFKSLKLLVDVDYTGGFQTSVDVSMLFGRFAQLSIKLTHLSGKVRLKLSREPFTHWAFAFVDMPILDFQIDSQWQGKQVKHLVPFITQQFRRIIQRKHVWPNYKIRYRPLFPNPLYLPSPAINAFEYVKTTGVLEVTVLWCTRLNTALVVDENSEIFCSLSIDQQPIMQNSNKSSTRSVTILLTFTRHGINDPIGMRFSKILYDAGVRSVQVLSVEKSSTAERCGFKQGDVVLAVNNVPVTTERQLSKLLSGTAGELSVLVERTIHEETKASPTFIKKSNSVDTISVSDNEEIPVPKFFEKVESGSVEGGSTTKGSHRRSHSVAALNSSTLSCDQVANTFRKDEVFCVCADGESNCNCSNIDFESFDAAKGRRIHNGYEIVLNKCSNMRRVRSETEIAGDHFWINEKPKLTSSNSPESTPAVVHKDSAKKFSNVPDDNTMTDITNIAQRHNGRAADMVVAGKARVSGFWYRHKNTGSGTEIVIDTLSQSDVSVMRPRLPPSISTTEKKMSSPLNSRKRQVTLQSGDKSNRELSKAPSMTLSTQPLRMSEDLRWGQSLHFNLNPHTSKYLNVTVRVKPLDNEEGTITAAQSKQMVAEAAQMLGYTSIYVPQLLDDCQLTLSNCHQELFTLRPPFYGAAKRPLTLKASEESRRAGFDERLCYGDIVLAFRYFPSGLPTDVQQTSGRCVGKLLNICEKHSRFGDVRSGNFSAKNAEHGVDFVRTNDTDTSETSDLKHHFETVFLKGSTICAVCRGKVWLKTAAHCTGCMMVCHNKCISKVSIICSQHLPIDDSVFETVGESNSSAAEPEERQPTRRRRIANKVSERISSTWKSVGRKKTSFHVPETNLKGKNEHAIPVIKLETNDVVPVASAIPDVFALLELPGNLSQMMYQPGNAYNEQMIKAAKITGKDMFADLDPVVRKARINGDVEKIQQIINQTTIERLRAMENMKEDTQESSTVKFAQLEDRLQALAVLMLHYCAALQNCSDNEEGLEYHNERQDDGSERSPVLNIP